VIQEKIVEIEKQVIVEKIVEVIKYVDRYVDKIDEANKKDEGSEFDREESFKNSTSPFSTGKDFKYTSFSPDKTNQSKLDFGSSGRKSELRKSSIKQNKTDFLYYLQNYKCEFAKPLDDLWHDYDTDKNGFLDREEA
jgi:hypothetical protein